MRIEYRKQRFDLLLSCFILGFCSHISQVQASDADTALDDYLRREAREVLYHQQLPKQEKIEKIRWRGTFTEKEKKGLVEFLDGQSGYVTASWSKVMKGDLNKDGGMEYIVENLLIADPQPSSFGTVLAVVRQVEEKLDLIVASPPTKGRTSGRDVRIDLLDVDQDGLMDLAVREHDPHGDPEDPRGNNDYAAIYRNNQMRFQQIYEQEHMYDELRFKDLDSDGRLEVLETVRELPYETYQHDPKWRWINIYQWNGVELKKVNEKFPSFYQERKKVYEDLLREASAKSAEYRAKGKTTIWDTTVEAMQEYIARIEAMETSNR